jgi:hypothetical protein
MSFILMVLNKSIINPWAGPADKRLSVHKVAWLMGQGAISGRGVGSGYSVTTSALLSRQRGLPSLSAGGGMFSERRMASSRF